MIDLEGPRSYFSTFSERGVHIGVRAQLAVWLYRSPIPVGGGAYFTRRGLGGGLRGGGVGTLWVLLDTSILYEERKKIADFQY